jgi:hypothetical protein
MVVAMQLANKNYFLTENIGTKRETSNKIFFLIFQINPNQGSDYKYQVGFLLRAVIYLFTFIKKARII